MEILSNTDDILPTLLGWTPLFFGAGLLLLVLRRRERAMAFLFSVSTRSYVIAVVASVLLMTGVCGIVEFRVNPFGDSDRYLARSLNIVRYGVFGYGTAPTALFPPGYSFLLLPAAWSLGAGRWTFFAINMAVLVAASWGVRSALRRLGVPLRPANFAALAVVLYPNRLLSTLLPASDIPFSLVYLCAFLCMLLSIAHPGRWRLALLTGLLGGAASLIRANGLPLLIPLAAGILFSRQTPLRMRARNAGLIALSALIVVAPWIVRNTILFGRVAPVSTNLGINLVIGNNPASTATYSASIDSAWGGPEAWRDAGGALWDEAQRDSFLQGRGLRYIGEYPGRFIVRGCGKVYHMIASDASAFGMLETSANLRTLVFSIFPQLPPRSPALGFAYAVWSVGYRLLFILNNAAYYFVMLLSLVLLFRHRRRLTPPEGVYLTAFLVTLALSFVLFGISRYKEPLPLLTLMLPLLALFPPRGTSDYCPGDTPR